MTESTLYERPGHRLCCEEMMEHIKIGAYRRSLGHQESFYKEESGTPAISFVFPITPSHKVCSLLYSVLSL